jgi:multidrug efflux pump subunit AcrA (membrane-fusion protein)
MRPKQPRAHEVTPAQRWAAAVQCCLDGDHEELARRVGGPEMPVPHNFKYRTVVARRAWLAARSGASVRNFDFESWERYLEERRAARAAAAAERAAAAEAQRRIDDIRLARMDVLKELLTTIRRAFADEHGQYMDKEEALEELLLEHGWADESKHNGVELTVDEVGWCWETGIHFSYRKGFIDASTLEEVKLLWEKVPQLEPLEQQQDARGNLRLRHNQRSVRKLRAARHCLLEAMLFATGEQVTSAVHAHAPPAHIPS